MTLFPKPLIFLTLLFAALIGGFLYGRHYEHYSMLENIVHAFADRKAIDDETSHLSPIDACIALGGLPDECATFLRGMDETAKSK